MIHIKPKLRFKGFNDDINSFKLGSLVNYKKGYAFKAKDEVGKNEGIPLIKISNLQKGKVNNSYSVYMPKSFETIHKDNLLDNNDVLVTTVGSWPNNINSVVGKVSIYKDRHEKCLLNQNIVALKSKNNIIDSDYLYNLLSDKNFFNYIVNLARGNANQASITLKDIFNYDVYTPSLKEQSEVGLLFRKIDKLIELKGNKIDVLERIKRGYVQKLFNNLYDEKPKLRFKEFNDRWKTTKIGNEFDLQTGKSKFVKHSRNNIFKYPILSSTSVVGFDDTFDYEGNFVLIARVGDAGKLYKYDGKAKITDNTMYINSRYSGFLFFLLQNYNFKKLSFGTTRKLIKSSDLKKSIITLPSEKEMLKLECLMNLIDKQVNLQKSELWRLKSLKKGYLQNMLV